MCLEVLDGGLRLIAMDVFNDDAKGGSPRFEVLTGPARRRRWSTAEKGRIGVETMEPGATATEVARRWQLCPQQVWGWRQEARTGDLALPSEASVAIQPAFVPIVAETPRTAAGDGTIGPGKDRVARTPSVPTIEIKLAGAASLARRHQILWVIERDTGRLRLHSAYTEKPPAECGSEAACMHLIGLAYLVAGAGFEPAAFRL